MKLEDFEKVLLEESKSLNLDFSKEQIKNFYDYMIGVLEWNDKINVTAITNENMFIVKHFVDSLAINKFMAQAKSIIDIGTGGGFPGIPLKIMNYDKKVTLIDSVNKKLNVIRDITKDMDLGELEILHSRAEDLASKQEYREAYDIATTRAVSNFSTILEYMLPFIKVGGYAICMKGPNYTEEFEEAKVAIEVLGGKFDSIERLNVGNELERNIIIIKKVKNTPKKFPRGQGKPLKEPIR